MDGLPVGNGMYLYTHSIAGKVKIFFVFYFVDRVIIACIRTENVLFLIFFVKRNYYSGSDEYIGV